MGKINTVSKERYDALYKAARIWENVAKKTMCKNLQLYNANRTLMLENETYIMKAFTNGGTVFKKR